MIRSVFYAGIAAVLFAASAAVAQPATSADPERLALARQIFEAQGGAQNANNIGKSLEQSMLANVADPATKARIAESVHKVFTTLMPRMYDDMAQYYAIDFTDAQLKDILAFYKSPTGQALREKQPVLAGQIGASMAKMMPKVQLSVLENVCSQIECNAQQKQAMAQLEQAIPADQRF